MSTGAIENFMPIMEEYASKSAYVLEIGCGTGDGSTTSFTQGLEKRGGDDRLYISVDNNYDPNSVFQLFSQFRPNVPYWHFVSGDSTKPETREAVEQIAGERKPDIIFIDTIHDYEHMSRELAVWGSYAHDGTIWLFHDTYMFGVYNHMTEAIKGFAQANGWEYWDISTEMHGFGGMRRPSAALQPEK